MLSFEQIRKELEGILNPIYGKRESQQIIRIYLEDKFGLKPGFRHPLDENQGREFNKDKSKFEQKIPVQYIVGKAYFYDGFYKVNANTLIPRPETEELVHYVVKNVQHGNIHPARSMLDIGTGTGCIAISIKKKLPQMAVTAIDISENALKIASENAFSHDVSLNFRNMDFLDRDCWASLPSVDLIVSNPPYISNEEYKALDSWIKEQEPAIALTPDHEDPLIFYKNIFKFMSRIDSNTRHGVLEISEHRKNGIITCLLDYPDLSSSFHRDLQGKDRILHVSRK